VTERFAPRPARRAQRSSERAITIRCTWLVPSSITPFGELVEQVMTTEPYASAARVVWIVDDGASHNGARSIARMHKTWPTGQSPSDGGQQFRTITRRNSLSGRPPR
jgi:hypothetical protein